MDFCSNFGISMVRSYRVKILGIIIVNLLYRVSLPTLKLNEYTLLIFRHLFDKVDKLL